MEEPKSKASRPNTYDRLKKQKQPTIGKCRIIMDAEIDLEYRETQQEWGLAQIIYTDNQDEEHLAKLREAKEKYDDVRARAMQHSEEFKFRSLGKTSFRQLLDAHAPTDAQVATARDKGEDPPDWDVDSFPQALISAACISHELFPDDVADMFTNDDWSEAELNDLFTTAIQVQNRRRLIEVGNASGV